MATISSAGLGSGLDVDGIVSKLMAIEKQPLSRLTTKEVSAQAKISAYGSIKGAMSAFQSAMAGLSSASRYTSLSASTSDSAIATASAVSTAAAGTYSLEVSKLAKAQKLNTGILTTGAAGSATNIASVNDVIGTGSLTIQLGTYSGGTFTANADKAATTITIDSSKKTLSGVRDAINAANAGVSAAIVNDGNGFRLSLTATDTGAANSVKIAVNDTEDGNNTDSFGLSQLAYDPAAAAGAGKNLSETQAAQNAEFKLDGIFISKASNSVTDAIQGVTLTLAKETEAGKSATVTVSRSTSSLTSAAQEFVKAYNELAKTITDLTKYDSKTKEAGMLQGDSIPRSILNQVRSAMTQNVLGLDGKSYNLPSMGISFQKDGTLKVDSAKLSALATSNPDAIAGFFATTGRASDANVKYLSASTSTSVGSYALTVDQMATQGTVVGSAVAGLNIDNTNKTLSFTIDGTSATVTLAEGAYASASALAAEIQSKVNGASAFKGAGLGVTVSASGGVLSIASNTFGSDSNVAVSGDGAVNLLGAAPATTAGVNVAGTLNGAAGTGSGQTLQFDSGIKLSVTGGSTGDRGTVNYTRGFGSLLDKLAGEILDTKGSIASANAGLEARVKDINKRREFLNRQLAATETRLRAQFTTLDTAMSKMTATSSYLSQQLSSLGNLISG